MAFIVFINGSFVWYMTHKKKRGGEKLTSTLLRARPLFHPTFLPLLCVTWISPMCESWARRKYRFLYILQECSNQVAGDATENVFNVIDAFETPRFTYSLDRKKFLSDSSLGLGKATIFAGNFTFQQKRRKVVKGWINVRVCWCVKFGIWISIWQSTDLLLCILTHPQQFIWWYLCSIQESLCNVFLDLCDLNKENGTQDVLFVFFPNGHQWLRFLSFFFFCRHTNWILGFVGL